MLSRRRFTAATVAAAATAAMSAPLHAAATAARAAGFFVPDEAAPHQRTWMQWPVSRAAYGTAHDLAAAQAVIADVANTIVAIEPVTLLMATSREPRARRLLSAAVEVWHVPTDDLWCRDSGPLFVVDGRGGLAVSHLNFNGWGRRWPHANDARIARRVADRLGLRLFDNGLVGEGGGVETDGDGTLLAHASSWVNPNRNRAPRAAVERLLLDAYGADKVIWAPGLAGHDVTDYHIDALARFCGPGRVAIQIGERRDPADVWSRTDFATLEVLQTATDARGRKLDIVRLPEPETEEWLSSYANYYVCNGAVLASASGDREADGEAARILGTLYPGRQVVMMNTDVLGAGGGGIHCATQQMPAV